MRERVNERVLNVEHLLHVAGSDIHAEDDEALRLSAEYGHVDVVRLLLDAGADVHAEDDYALRWAARYGHTEVVAIINEHIARKTDTV